MKKVNHGQTHYFTCDSKDKTIELRAQNDEKLLLVGSIKFPIVDTIESPAYNYTIGEPKVLQFYTLNEDLSVVQYRQGSGVWLNKSITSGNDPLLAVAAWSYDSDFSTGQQKGAFLIYDQTTDLVPFELTNDLIRTTADSTPALVLRASISGNTVSMTFREEYFDDLSHRFRKFEFRSDPSWGIYEIDDSSRFIGSNIYGNFLVSWGVFGGNSYFFHRSSDSDPFTYVGEISNFVYEGSMYNPDTNSARLAATVNYTASGGLRIFELTDSGSTELSVDTSRPYRKPVLSSSYIACTDSNPLLCHILTSNGFYLYTISLLENIIDLDLFEDANGARLALVTANKLLVFDVKFDSELTSLKLNIDTTTYTAEAIASVSINGDHIAIGFPTIDGLYTDVGAVYLFEYSQADSGLTIQYTNSIDSNVFGFIIDAPTVKFVSDNKAVDFLSGALQIPDGDISVNGVYTNDIKVVSSESATSLSTGGIQVPNGGVSASSIYATKIKAGSTETATSLSTGAIQVPDGGISAKGIYTNSMKVVSSETATSLSTGAIQVPNGGISAKMMYSEEYTGTLANIVNINYTGRPYLYVRGNVEKSIPTGNNTLTDLTSFWGDVFVNIGTTLNYATGVVTVPTTGYYQINVGLYYRSNSTGWRGLGILSSFDEQDITVINIGSNTFKMSMSVCHYLIGGETIKIWTRQTSGGDLGCYDGVLNIYRL